LLVFPWKAGQESQALPFQALNSNKNSSNDHQYHAPPPSSLSILVAVTYTTSSSSAAFHVETTIHQHPSTPPQATATPPSTQTRWVGNAKPHGTFEDFFSGPRLCDQFFRAKMISVLVLGWDNVHPDANTKMGCHWWLLQLVFFF